MRKNLLVKTGDCRLAPTHRDAELGHGDVVWVDAETHTLLDV